MFTEFTQQYKGSATQVSAPQHRALELTMFKNTTVTRKDRLKQLKEREPGYFDLEFIKAMPPAKRNRCLELLDSSKSQLRQDIFGLAQVDFKANGFDTFPAISMNGQQVFRWAVSEMTRVCRESLDTAGITVEDLDAFIPHQANNRITDALVRALELPDSVAVARDIITTGNTSAASIPLAMDRMLASGEIHQGGNALLVGFGAGLVFASEVVTLP